MKAIILCAGRGTRLQPLTDVTPKTLLMVQGKPILQHILENLPKQITEVFLVVDYLKDQIETFAREQQFSFSITCVQQTGNRKGTLAAIRSVQPLLHEGEKFLVLNGDDIIQASDLEKMFQHERAFAVQHAIMPRYYKVMTRTDGILEGFEPQTEAEKVSGVPIATGTYFIDTGIFEFEPRLLHGDEIGIPQTILDNKDTYAVSVVEFLTWQPINSKDDLAKANE